MTRWVRPEGGRQKGPVGLLKAWVAVLTRPRRFFADGVAAGDQGPGLLFAMAVVLVEEATRLALVPGAVPPVGGSAPLGAGLLVGAAVLLVTPLVLHLVAAVQVLALLAVPAARRAGVSETVQTIAYATAPCALAGVPVPAVRALVTLYGAVLLVVGLSVRNDVSMPAAAALGAIPAALAFGYAFRGFEAWQTLVGW